MGRLAIEAQLPKHLSTRPTGKRQSQRPGYLNEGQLSLSWLKWSQSDLRVTCLLVQPPKNAQSSPFGNDPWGLKMQYFRLTLVYILSYNVRRRCVQPEVVGVTLPVVSVNTVQPTLYTARLARCSHYTQREKYDKGLR